MSSAKKQFSADENLLKGLKVSLGFHIAVFAIFSIKAALFTPQKIDYSAAIRVDMVALPDKVDPNQLPPPKVEEAKPEAKPEPAAKPAPKPEVVEKPVKAPKKDVEAVNLNKDKNKQKEALEKLKAMAAIEEMKKEAEKEKETKKMAGVGDTKAQPSKVKGNILSPGTALTGLNRLQHDNYLSTLDQQIKQQWVLPEWLAKKPFRAQVRLKIDEKGRILSREIVLSSGNSSYDDLALDTIDKAAPFVAPPEKFVSIVAVSGLLIGFPE
ncbi:TonB family protein [Bdellovibrio sp. HCB337]|uniref:TonB family protein n=1 Tax=Bdellovibrio sp. HCB337 TaxID=3394358 RepID=UPI0039A45891